ncbi:hypothetical protein AGLY_007137 [Aphis glycines]|uniref:Uncharacterized protein n=1 Tax=Aphis glycines TaxID=307491 RepID=A0A6G0TPL2_APHGL|nr:hypothetical protein AGLY_007137 [Aphis glycines]
MKKIGEKINKLKFHKKLIVNTILKIIHRYSVIRSILYPKSISYKLKINRNNSKPNNCFLVHKKLSNQQQGRAHRWDEGVIPPMNFFSYAFKHFVSIMTINKNNLQFIHSSPLNWKKLSMPLISNDIYFKITLFYETNYFESEILHLRNDMLFLHYTEHLSLQKLLALELMNQLVLAQSCNWAHSYD